MRERLYRGRCANNLHLDASIARFNEKRRAILALVDAQPGLTDRARSTMTKYINRFYDTIESPKRVQRELVKRCI